jgi:hypothetical protein
MIILNLIGLFWLWCSHMLLIITDPREVLSCGIFYSILIGSTTLSNLYLASMSIDRSIIILSPSRYRLIVTRSRVLLRLILIGLIIILLLIPHHFSMYYNPRRTLFVCDFHSSVDGRSVRLWSLIHAILFVSIPSLIVCISSFILLHNRYKHKRTYKKNLSASARRMYRSSIFIFFVSLGIFLCISPTAILEIYMVHDRFFNHINCSIRWKIHKILLNCFLTLSSINYSMKFYIHLIISKSFRMRFIQFIRCQSNQNSLKSTPVNNEHCLLPLRKQDKATTVQI